MLKLETHSRVGGTIFAKPIRRRALSIRAEVNFVNAEEAKKLIAAEGYTILDVRDKSQFDRAHIKSCTHVPLFIENQDNDPGNLQTFLLHCDSIISHFLLSLESSASQLWD